MTFLDAPSPTADARRMYDNDVARDGYVMNLSHLWAHHPSFHSGLIRLLDEAATEAGLSFRDRGVLIVACASTLGDAYCSLAWGKRLASVAGDDTAQAVVRGDDSGLDDRERVLAGWARKITKNPNGTTKNDTQELRDAGYDDAQIFALTVFVSLRAAFAMVNDALGALPDDALLDSAVSPAVTFGRFCA
ncbi:hypothetical protein Lesp02_07690 [Lentzea sp. NBRC 105346]|uniref:carboxymuconolactone decarboxylase family protein n=1 Tax=Lentzea sp. NBRC 105346 TaxID=3032205 RepID=UPI0024A3398C|nr:hypothetical protein [Lentzea sp. NBRC 105346]GLZ28579.1 hypothetical protein Lesp02_07690 [Lentzea sp. NBRC 105346]